MQIQMITNIEDQAKYHNYVLLQSTSLEIAEKFPYHILSIDNQIKYTEQQKKYEGQSNQAQMSSDAKERSQAPQNNPSTTLSQYNYSVDAVSYRISGKRIILSQGKWLRNILKAQDLSRISQENIFVPYQGLQIAKGNLINFFYYSGQITATFVKIFPKYLLGDNCIVYQFEDNQGQITQIQKILSPAKTIDHSCKLNAERVDSIKDSPNFDTNFYNFKSDYALISDLHFLNCFVQGKKQIASYLKVQLKENFQSLKSKDNKTEPQKYFIWCIDPKIYQSLKMIYITPKL